MQRGLRPPAIAARILAAARHKPHILGKKTVFPVLPAVAKKCPVSCVHVHTFDSSTPHAIADNLNSSKIATIVGDPFI